MRNSQWVRGLLFALILFSMSVAAFAQIGISISFGPPALPIYEQPPCPSEGYIWTPGYWAFDYDYDDYYWVPGTWVEAPEVGLLWTPGYWAWQDDRFFFHEGYWAQEVGFYGGIVYGFGYFGEGYEGGRWDNGRFFYNRSVNNVNTTVIRNVYNTTIINNNTTINRVSYNGGNGGVTARPTQRDEAADRARHIAPVAVQKEHLQAARGDQQLRASVNQGKPPLAATPKPGAFRDRGVVQAKEAGAPYKPNRNAQPRDNQSGQRADNIGRDNNNARPGNNNRPNDNNSNRPGNVVHPKDLPPSPRWNPPDSGDAKRNQKYQQEQDKLQAKQDQERQKLERNQDKEHQKMQQQKADDARQQQIEQRHQQQTQQLQQRQEQQQKKMQNREQPQPRDKERAPKDERPPN